MQKISETIEDFEQRLDSVQVERLNEAMREIERGSVEFIGAEYIRSLVARFLLTGERFVLKAGFDPTAPDLHLGHTVLIQKLANPLGVKTHLRVLRI